MTAAAVNTKTERLTAIRKRTGTERRYMTRSGPPRAANNKLTGRYLVPRKESPEPLLLRKRSGSQCHLTHRAK